MQELAVTDGLIIDCFAGAGGASTGIEEALGGRKIDIAINHCPKAVATHKANHPNTRHYCENIMDVDPAEVTGGLPIDFQWFSPDCTHHSTARGGKPVDKNIRGLAWITLRWGAVTDLRMFALENVKEFLGWGPLTEKRDKQGKIIYNENGTPAMIADKKRKGETFRAFIECLTTGLDVKTAPDILTEIIEVLGPDFPYSKILKGLGYTVTWKLIRACDYGAPTIRQRIFIQARKDGLRLMWIPHSHGKNLTPYRVAANCIDFSLPGQSIFNRKRPLAPKTLRRIGKGLKKFVFDNPQPFIVTVNHSGDNFRGQSLDEPLNTITMKGTHALVTPILDRQYGKSTGNDINEPMGTITAGGGGKTALIMPFLTECANGSSTRSMPIDEPLRTITAMTKGGTHALVTSHMIKFRGDNIGFKTDEPIHTISAGGTHIGEIRTFLRENCGPDIKSPGQGELPLFDQPKFSNDSINWGEQGEKASAFMVQYYGTSDAAAVDAPMNTVTVKDRFALITIHGIMYRLIDITLRMLQPHELYRAQGFPEDYIIDTVFEGKPLIKEVQVNQCGNSVCPAASKAVTTSMFQPIWELAA